MVEAALALAVPLACCLLAVPLGRHAPWLLWAAIPAGIAAAFGLAAGGGAVHALGGWEPPLGIALRADGLAASFLGLSTLVCAAAGLFALRYFPTPAGDAREPGRTKAAFWPLFFALWAAVNAVFLSGDLFNLYVALELLTLAAVAMVALDGRASTLAAALRYLLFALFGSLAFLIGAALLYGEYGTLDMALLAARAAPTPATIAAAAAMSAGLFAKAALFPFHAWLPPAHSGAPAPASALLSALVVKAAFYIVLRLWFDVLPGLAAPALATGFGALGALAVLFGGAMALVQTRLKPIVAYSTVAQLGYLFLLFPLVFGAGTGGSEAAALGWQGGVLHGLAHGLAKAAMFLAAGALMLAAGGDRLDGLAGMGKAAPVASFAFALAAISLMGLPPSGGFLAKYLMLKSAVSGAGWIWALVLIGGGLLSAAYLFRPLPQLMRPLPKGAAPARPLHWSLEWVPLGLAAAAILLGLAAMPVLDLIAEARP
jgi:multicomponent Na+:H+ antiporter subunit D